MSPSLLALTNRGGKGKPSGQRGLFQGNFTFLLGSVELNKLGRDRLGLETGIDS